MSDYYQLKNASLLAPPSGTNLGTNSNQYANVYVSNEVNVGGVPVTSTTLATYVTPKITSVVYPNDDQALDVTGGTITINGSGFQPGCQVLVNQTLATSVTYISSSQLTALLPATPAGSYVLYVSNPDSSVAIRVNGVTFSGLPVWVTTTPLPDGIVDVPINIQLVASYATSYALTSGYSLPPGLTLSSSGLLSGTVSGVATYTTYNFSVTAIDPEAQDSPKNFAISITIGDPYIKYTSLLLNAETPTLPYSSDASYNNFLLTNTSTVAPAPQPKHPYQAGYYSTYYNGSTDYFTLSSGASFAFGTNNFTFEAFVFLTAIPNATWGSYFIDARNASQTGAWACVIGSGLTIDWYNGITNSYYNTVTPIALNTWTHVAYTRSGTTSSWFINGTRTATYTDAGNYNVVPTTSYIGARFSAAGFMTGNISNMRVVNGTAVYDPTATTITVPTSPLTAIANTKLLVGQSYRFLDNSTNNFTLTAVGTPAVSAQQPFTLPNTWSSIGSTYFDGTSALTAAVNSAFNLSTGAPNFTIEFWLYVPTGSNYIYINKDGVSGSSWGSYIIQISSANTVLFLVAPNSGSGATSCSGTVVPNTWTHIAGVKNGNLLQLYLNGVLVQTSTITNAMVDGGGGLQIGKNANSTPYYAVGNVCNLRIVKGAAVYSGNFTPPILAPLGISGPTSIGAYPSIANVNTNFDASTTSLLTFQTPQPVNNNIFVDNSYNNFVITRGGSPTVGSLSPYTDRWGVYNPDTVDSGISIAANSALDLGTADFTIEVWVNPIKLPTTNAFQTTSGGYQTIIGTGPNSASTGNMLYIGTTNLKFDLGSDGAGPIDVAHNIIPGNWYHIAITRSGTTVRAFINGTLVQLVNGVSTAWYPGYGWGILRSEMIGYWTGGWWYGNASNLRVVKNQALYTGNIGGSQYFVPSTAPLTTTSVGSTGSGAASSITGSVILLTLQDNRLKDNSSNAFTISTTNLTSTVPYSPFAPSVAYSPTLCGGTGYFNGSSDYLAIADNVAMQFGTYDFTIEFWLNTTSSNGCLFSRDSNVNVNYGNMAASVANGKYEFMFNPNSGDPTGRLTLTSTTSVNNNTWMHCAVTRSGNTWRLFINGAVEATGTSSLGFRASSAVFYVGCNLTSSSPSTFYNGYLANFRMIKGAAVYTGNFTPPIAVLTPSGATSAASYPMTTNVNTTFSSAACSLLLNFGSAGIFDAVAKNDLITFGDTKINTITKKYNTGSIYFDGTGDYLTIPSTQFSNWNFNTDDFTIEAWIYPTAFSGDKVIVSSFASWATSVNFFFGVRAGSPNILIFRAGDSTPISLNGNSTLNTNTWYHVAVSRSSGTVRMFVDGVLQTATYSGSAVNISNTVRPLVIGSDDATPGEYFSGYIDEIRLTKYGRYTANFTPPAAPFAVR